MAPSPRLAGLSLLTSSTGEVGGCAGPASTLAPCPTSDAPSEPDVTARCSPASVKAMCCPHTPSGTGCSAQASEGTGQCGPTQCPPPEHSCTKPSAVSPAESCPVGCGLCLQAEGWAQPLLFPPGQAGCSPQLGQSWQQHPRSCWIKNRGKVSAGAFCLVLYIALQAPVLTAKHFPGLSLLQEQVACPVQDGIFILGWGLVSSASRCAQQTVGVGTAQPHLC